MSGDVRSILNRIKRRGSLIWVMLMVFGSQAALAASLPMDMAGIPDPRSMDMEAAKNSIVRIQAGVENEDGKTETRSIVSGFIVSSDGNNVYIVTTLHAVDFGEKGSVKISVKNDSTVDAGIILKNKENDFCILSAENSFNDRSIAPLRIEAYEPEGEKITAGDEVIALGFSDSIGDSSDYNAADVSVQKGTVEKTGSENGGIVEHNITVNSGSDGGALVDKDGYVVGLINPTIGTSCARDISEIDAMLVSTGIVYSSKDKDTAYRELYDLCAGAEDIYKRADKESKQGIAAARENAMEVLTSAPYDREALTEALAEFRGAVDGAHLKTPKTLILIYALAAVIALLIIKLITLIEWNRKNAPRVSWSAGERRKKDDIPGGSPYQRNYPPTIAQLRDLNTGRVFSIDKDNVLIGKSAESDYTIPHNNKVSRKHAVIEKRGSAYYVRDLNSTNGTFLNNVRIGIDREVLHTGDIISMAGEQIEFIQR